jgi:hypothetical protein
MGTTRKLLIRYVGTSGNQYLPHIHVRRITFLRKTFLGTTLFHGPTGAHWFRLFQIARKAARGPNVTEVCGGPRLEAACRVSCVDRRPGRLE